MKVTMGSSKVVYEKDIMKVVVQNVTKYRKEKHLTQEEIADKLGITSIVAENVARYRKEKKLTQEAVAKSADIGFDFYRHFESGKGSIGISVKNLYRISVALGVKMGNLFDED